MPRPRISTRPGSRNRPAASEATSPAASSTPVIRIRSPSPMCAPPPCQTPACMRILSVLHPGGGHSGLLRDAAAAAGHELVEWTPGGGEELPGGLSDLDA